MDAQDETVIFDGDDTLWDIQTLYDEAKEQFYSLVDREGLDEKYARESFDNYDRSNVERFGFSKERFPTSMREFYTHLAQRAGRSPEQGVAEEAYHTGIQVFDLTPRLYPDAVPLLQYLKERYRLILYSMGEDDVQQQRVDALNLKPYFDRIFFPEDKTVEELEGLVSELDLTPARTWVIGNSLRSDVHPTLKAGLHAIWIERETWVYDDHPDIPPAAIVVSSLSEVPSVLASQTTLDDSSIL